MKVLVVSHPAVVPVNQLVYLELVDCGIDVTIALPSRWRHEYAQAAFAPVALPGLEGRLLRLPVALPGKPQRHFYLTRPGKILADTCPDVVFLEAESYSLVAAQWLPALALRGVPFGVQCAENIDRPLPAPVRLARRAVLGRAAFVASRSETAARLARSWGATGHVGLAPHAVPGWEVVPSPSERPFTVGYAGRLVPEKGLSDLLAAVRLLEAPVELVLVGDGEMRSALAGAPIPGASVRVITDITHEQMAHAYAQMDVLVLPSRTTPRWTEQFGRVIVEALWCGVPVIGSDSGEIPWLISLTGGGVVFREGDVDALLAALGGLRAEPDRRARLAAHGRRAVEKLFTVPAAASALQDLLRRGLGTSPGAPGR